MKSFGRNKKSKTSFCSVIIVTFFLFLCFFSFSGCTSKQKSTVPSVDFTHHTDGSRITEEELSAYQDYILSTLSITEKETTLIGTHTGLFSTVVSITLYDCTKTDLLKECFSLLAEYETILSRTMPGSELYTVNQNTSGAIELSPILSEVLGFGLSYREASLNRFDITIAPLSDLWAFGSANAGIPSEASLKEALAFVNGSSVSLTGNTLTYPAGTKFDLGAVAKGWLSDRIADHLKENGIENAMINLGGNTFALGEKPDKIAYRIGISMPFASGSELAGIVSVKNKSVVTSGIYERYFIKDNKLYHHLLDAATGYPAENELLSVTIVCENSAIADALSTVCFLLGKEKGLTLINELNRRVEVHAVFLSGTYDIATHKVTNLQYHYSDGFVETTEFEKSQPDG